MAPFYTCRERFLYSLYFHETKLSNRLKIGLRATFRHVTLECVYFNRNAHNSTVVEEPPPPPDIALSYRRHRAAHSQRIWSRSPFKRNRENLWRVFLGQRYR